jgi:hypothetical protein
MITETNEHHDYRLQTLVDKYGDDFLLKCERYKSAEHFALGFVRLLEYNGGSRRFKIQDGKGWVGWIDMLDLDNFVL